MDGIILPNSVRQYVVCSLGLPLSAVLLWFLQLHFLSASLHLGGWLSTSFCVSVICLSAFFFLSLNRCLWSFSLSHCLLLKFLQHKVTLMSTGTGADSLGLRSPPVSVCQSPYLSNTLRRVPLRVIHHYYAPHLCSQLPRQFLGPAKQVTQLIGERLWERKTAREGNKDLG